MSAAPQMRRAERAMTGTEALVMLQRGFVARLATIGKDGYPYCLPLLYVGV